MADGKSIGMALSQVMCNAITPIPRSQAPIARLVSGVSAQGQKVETFAGDRNKVIPVTRIIDP